MAAEPPAALRGRTAIVTGASSGIGRAIALRLALAGADVVVADVAVAPWHGDDASYLTGVSLLVDGGWMAG